MANTTENIITQISRKNTTGFDTPFSIGSAAKHIASVRGTEVNNIEENFLLGSNTIITEEDLGNGVLHTIKEFRKETTLTDYYYIDAYKYDNYSSYKRYFQGDTLYLPDDDTYYDGTGSTLIGSDLNIYSLEDDIFGMVNTEAPITPAIVVATLKYVGSNGTEISVAEKTTYAKETQQGRITQKSIIRNLL